MKHSAASSDRALRIHRLLTLAAIATSVAGISAVMFSLMTDAAGALLMLAVACLAGGVVAALVARAVLSRALRLAALEQEALVSSANLDILTGSHSRSYFLQALKQVVFHGSSAPVVYLQIDMDNLKTLNDSDGHGAGDAALVRLVATIRRLAPEALIGRLGGDEFGIAIIGQSSKAGLRRLALQILAEIGEPADIAGRATALSATIGVAAFPADATHVDDLISNADLALYRGKRTGRGQVVLFDADMLADERHKRFIERELRAAILMNELELFYQPIYSADASTLKGYEALVRWNHTVRGRISPAEFIDIAEQSMLIDMLGDWVLRQVCHDLPRLGAPVSVNVSTVQLRRQHYAERFVAVLKKHDIAGHQMVVEITESIPLHAGPLERANLDALRAMGIRIAIDDFGAGHASLQYLRSLTFDILKIDRAYVQGIGSRPVDVAIVTAICDVARAINVEVVAEGVETVEQLVALRAAGCTAVQGFLLGHPAPLSAFADKRAALRPLERLTASAA